MKSWQILWVILLTATLSVTAGATFETLRSDVSGELPQTVVLQHDQDQIQLEYRLPGVEMLEGMLEGQRWDRVEIPGGGYELELGAPEVPHFTRLLVIPATAGVQAQFEALETRTIPNVKLMPAQGSSPEEVAEKALPVKYDMTVYARDAFYPQTRVQVGDPAVMRGVRVVPLRANPVQYNPVTHELQVTTRFRVTVTFEGTDLRNVPARQIPHSKEWAALMRAQTLNYDDQEFDEINSGSYLIVCVNNAALINLLQPFIEWKRQKGHTVSMSNFAAGASNSSIKTLIQTAYNTWSVPPEYVLLVGDAGGSYTLPGWSPSDIDHPYSQLDGSDILADVAIGRFPAENSTEATVMVNKILFYEKVPYTTTTDWYHQGVLIAGSSLSGSSTIQTNRWIKTRMLWNEFTRIDTLWYTMGTGVPTVVTNAINNGVTFFNYRGYLGISGWSNGNIDALTNGRKLPFCTVITCGTGGFSGESDMEHFFVVGTPTVPKGAIASVGTATSSTNTRCNNTVNYGIYAGVFDEGITQPGTALVRGKLELYNAYITNDAGNVSNYSLWNALAGDPGTELFNAAIRFMTSAVPDSIPVGQNSLTMTVTETGVGPVEGVTVCYYKSNEMQEVGTTDENGQLTMPIGIITTGNVKVTVTKHNFYPIVDSLNIVQAAVAVGYFNHTVDDDNVGGSQGDNDGVINPHEIIQLATVLKNYGNSTTATGISATVSEVDPFVTVSNATQTYPNLAPGATGNSSGSFLLNVADNCPSGHIVPLNLATTSNQGNWTGLMELAVVSYHANITAADPSGSDTLLSPGETTNFIVTLRNDGGKVATSLTASLVSLDPLVTVNDNSASFGTVNLGQVATCSGDPFNFSASVTAPAGHVAGLQVTFLANGALQTDTVTVTLGNLSIADPQGPDEYGYYCFDNGDANYAQCPVYSWMEIDPAFGGSGLMIPIYDSGENNDASAFVRLPFTFRYYGQNFDTITVCSNGWISTNPDVSFTDFRNYPIPSAVGPTGHICAFWDDLVTTGTGHVYSYNDAANHRFFIQWSRMPNVGSGNSQTFQIILYDPAYYTTPTGDGEIVFQYYAIGEIYGIYDDNPYSTVGIERPDHQDGIEVVYWNTYDSPATAHLQAGRAYKFTTAFTYQPPTTNIDVTLTPVNPPIQIPASGGSFSYNATVSNQGTSPASFTAWIMQLQPNGVWQGPMLGPINLTLPGSGTVTRLRTQNVPSTALPGEYTYRGYVGLYAYNKWDSSSFTYTKLTSGDGPIVDNWDNYGESFELTAEEMSGLVPKLPHSYSLQAAYPNPFNPTTTLRYDLPQAGLVNLTVFNLLGRQVVQLVSGPQEAGSHQVAWNAAGLPSGVYLVRLQTGNYHTVQKVVLMK